MTKSWPDSLQPAYCLMLLTHHYPYYVLSSLHCLDSCTSFCFDLFLPNCMPLILHGAARGILHKHTSNPLIPYFQVLDGTWWHRAQRSSSLTRLHALYLHITTISSELFSDFLPSAVVGPRKFFEHSGMMAWVLLEEALWLDRLAG